MDLLARVAIGVIIILVIAGVVYAFASVAALAQKALNQSQAVQIVMKDLRTSAQNAQIGLINVSASKLKNDSWNVVLSIAYNSTRACPTLLIESFDYPATGLVPSVENVYTQGCAIYGLNNAPGYVVGSPYIAMVEAYNSGLTFKNYVDRYGYNTTFVSAKFYPSVVANYTPLSQPFSNVWIVNYSAPLSPVNQYAVLYQNGTFAANYTLGK
ncbi:MAG: hypothetical protein KGH98_04155 [Candidatus Micrarchaeota archaeon]|nr:hypothetical protein [Candidatus Micrarchaeota archaeon]